MNPYILCYKKRASASAQQKLTEIQDDQLSSREKKYLLPDFWYLQLQHGIERSFRNQFVCKHNCLKPYIESKMVDTVRVSALVYEDLHHFYRRYPFEELPEFRKKSLSSEGSPPSNFNHRL
jgi:hypothetical protein